MTEQAKAAATPELKPGRPVTDLKADQERADVVEILVKYSDGTTKQIEKGAIITEEENAADPNFMDMNIEFKKMTGGDVIRFMQGLFTLSCQILQIRVEDDAIDEISPENE